MAAASIVQTVAFATNTLIACVSVRYDLDRANRAFAELSDTLEDLQHVLGTLHTSNIPKNDQKPIRDLIQEYKQMTSNLSLVLDGRHSTMQTRMPDVLQRQLSSCSRAVRAKNVVAIRRCVDLVRLGGSSENGNDPVLWRLQRWIGAKLSRLVGTKTFHVPDMIRSPSPSVLLASWLVMALAAAAYHETLSRREHRTTYLFGSALVALLLGMVEQSGVETVILTNVPWCLALGMLLDMLVRGILKARCHKGTEQRLHYNVLDVKECARW